MGKNGNTLLNVGQHNKFDVGDVSLSLGLGSSPSTTAKSPRQVEVRVAHPTWLTVSTTCCSFVVFLPFAFVIFGTLRKGQVHGWCISAVDQHKSHRFWSWTQNHSL
mgnify:CR=1 FL=1